MADTSVEEEFDFTSAMGAEAAEEAQKRYAGSGDRTPYLSMSDKETVIVRFITDAFVPGDATFPYNVPWITVDQHSMVPTKPAPANYSGTWPKSMSCVCRVDKVFRAKYGSCWVCENVKKKDGKPNNGSPRTWALVCMREEVKGDGSDALGGAEMKGKVLGIRDKTREVKKTDAEGKETDEVEVVKDIRMVNLGWKNFFASLQGMAGRYRTVLDRDFEITRKGNDTGTLYQIVALDPIDTTHPESGEKVRFDLRDPLFMVRYSHLYDKESPLDDVQERLDAIPDIRKAIARLASDDFYNRFFIPGKDGESSGDAKQTSGAPAAPSTEVEDNDALAALKERVGGYNPDEEGGESGGDAEPAAEVPEQPTEDKPAAKKTAAKKTAAKKETAAAASGGMQDFG